MRLVVASVQGWGGRQGDHQGLASVQCSAVQCKHVLTRRRAHRMAFRASDTQRSALGSTTRGKRRMLNRESMVKAVCGAHEGGAGGGSGEQVAPVHCTNNPPCAANSSQQCACKARPQTRTAKHQRRRHTSCYSPGQ